MYGRPENERERPFTPFPVVPWFYERPWLPPAGASEVWGPKVDVVDRGDSILVVTELPGVAADEVHIHVQGNTLRIHGERQRTEEISGERYYRRECSYGKFQRDVLIPVEVDQERVEADYNNGVLTVTLWKTSAEGPEQSELEKP